MTDWELLENISSRLDKVDTRFDLIDKRFDSVDKRFDLVDKRFDLVDKRFNLVEGQLKENTDIIHALCHRTEEIDAKYDGLAVNVQKAFARIEAKIDILSHRISAADGEIQLLKAK